MHAIFRACSVFPLAPRSSLALPNERHLFAPPSPRRLLFDRAAKWRGRDETRRDRTPECRPYRYRDRYPLPLPSSARETLLCATAFSRSHVCLISPSLAPSPSHARIAMESDWHPPGRPLPNHSPSISLPTLPGVAELLASSSRPASDSVAAYHHQPTNAQRSVLRSTPPSGPAALSAPANPSASSEQSYRVAVNHASQAR